MSAFDPEQTPANPFQTTGAGWYDTRVLSPGAAMRRRDFIKVVAGSAAAWPIAARAQQPALPVVGFLNLASAQNYARQAAAFLKGLGEAGYVDGQNVRIEYRWADGQIDRLPALAADLVRRQVNVIAATGTQGALAAKKATTTIPIVFEIGTDPIKAGLVSSLDRPGGNITGITQLNVEVAPKRLELLHELLPKTSVMALLVNPTDHSFENSEMQAAARNLGVELHIVNASSERDFEPAFADLARLGAGALLIGSSAYFVAHQEQLAELTMRHAVPAVFENRQFVAAGGLMSYGGSLADSYHLTGVYTGRILKGEKPADLPVQRGVKVELYINLKSAKTLGVSVPNTLAGRADELIE
jgi:putative tryptophan/tyrosine transport system substrate-binding protein